MDVATTDAPMLAAVPAALPPRPDESLTPFLDAAARCIERFGWARTSVRDVAAEAGVERTTVYRRVGSMGDILRLLVARELHALVALLPTWARHDLPVPEMAIDLLAEGSGQQPEVPGPEPPRTHRGSGPATRTATDSYGWH